MVKMKTGNIITLLSIIFFIVGLNAVIYDQEDSYKSNNDVDWRTAALQRIDTLRKAELEVIVVDSAGNPIPNVQVSVTMLRHEFPFGSAVAAKELMANTKDGEKYREAVEKYFNKVVLESDLAWNPWERSKASKSGSRYNREQTFKALHWLRDHNISIRGHYLSWAPVERFEQYKNNRNNPEVFKRMLFDHIEEKIKAVGPFIDEWIAINHIIAQHDSGIRLEHIFGKDIYVEILNFAHRLAPAAKLYINEGRILSTQKEPEVSERYFHIIEYLTKARAPLDGIGFMGHFHLNNLPPIEHVLHQLDNFSIFGLPIQITELDVRYGDRDKEYNLSEKQLTTQAEYTRDVMIAAFSHPSVQGIMLWGFWEGRHWYPSAALYRKDWSLKPNGQVWHDLVFHQWWTIENRKTNNNGKIYINGFLGEYEIVVEFDGQTFRQRLSLSKGGTRFTFILPFDEMKIK